MLPSYEISPIQFWIWLAILIPLSVIRWRRTQSVAHLFFFFVFWVYLFILVALTIAPLPSTGFVFVPWAQEPLNDILGRINLTPFDFGGLFAASPRVILDNLAGNILLTLPFGFGINFLSRVPFRRALWLALAVGLGLESAQLTLGLAFGGYRVVDINDALLNAMGVLIGFSLFRVFAWMYLAITRWFNLRHKGVLAYILNCARQS